MPRNLSPRAVSQALALEGTDIWLVLLEITHPSLATPFRAVRNTQDVVSQGKTFYAYPFDITLGDDDAERLPEVKLTIDNVALDLVEMIRTIADPPKVTIWIVLSSQPDVVEIQISNLVLREVDYDSYSINGTLYADDILSTRYPADLITPASGYFGLFR